MPGYVIHLSIAEEYLRKHGNKENHEEFIKGVLFPDSVKDKSKTHYGPSSSFSNIYKFLQENDLKSSFNRGYFMHLLTDYLFYNKYIDTFSKDMYTDYDLTNKWLINKYNIVLPKEITNCVFFKEGTNTTFLTKELLEKMIEEISNLDIDKVQIEAIEKPEKWTKIRPLKML